MHADTETAVGVFNKRSGTGSQSVSGLGFQPKAIIFYWTRQISTGTSGGTENYYGTGYSTGSSEERAVSFWSDQATIIVSAASDSGRMTSETSSILIQSTDGSVVGEASLTSFDSDGFTLDWTTSNSSDYLVRYMALGGDDIEEATVGTVGLSTSTGTQSVSGLGFRPDGVMFLSGGTSSHGSDITDGKFSLGFATDDGEAGWGTLVEDAVLLSSSTCSQQRTDRSVVLMTNSCNSTDALVSFQSSDQDGFVLDITDAPASSVDVFFLAVRGGSHEVGAFNAATSTGTQTVTTDFQGKSIFITGHNKTSSGSASANAAVSIGAATASAEGVIASNDWGGLLPDAEARTVSALYTAIENAGPTLTREASLDSFGTNDFTVDWTTNNGTAVETLFWLVGDSPTYDQSAYRWFENDDSTDVGAALGTQDSAVTLASDGLAFRLRPLVEVVTGKLFSSRADLQLQYVDRGSGTCAAPSGGTPASYTNVTGSTSIAYNNNATPNDGDALTSNVGDPTHGGDTIIDQTYEEASPVSNPHGNIKQGEHGLWDFSLVDFAAPPNTNFCLRLIEADGTIFGTYSQYAEITTHQYQQVDIVDSGGDSVTSPSMTMTSVNVSFDPQVATGTFGEDEQRIRVENFTNNPQWTVSIAADSGGSSVWDSGTDEYDFNDTSGSDDGGDADSVGGQMSVDPSTASVSPSAGCATTGLSLGSSSSFDEGTIDSITLISSGATADINCFWDMTGIDVSQDIPGEQPIGSYNIDMTLTITAI